MLVPIEQVNESVERYKDFVEGKKADAPVVPLDEAAIKSSRAITAGQIVSVEENLENRKEMLDAISVEPTEFAFERAIGKNDSVYSNFIALIAFAKQKVGRIVVKSGSRHLGYATGFMVSERLMLTNWHVFKEKEAVGQSEVEFSYELDMYGRSLRPTVFRLAPNDFYFSRKSLDYCIVAVEAADVSGINPLSSVGYHFLDPTLGKLGEEGKELLNIIHHPGGDYQQLSIRENKFTKILPSTIWYETDTAQGSSGSPVFNDQWQIVALHHSGVPLKSADGKHYLDKDNKIIQPVNGKIEESRVCWIANEGIRISVLLKDLFNEFPNNKFVAGMKNKPSDMILPSPQKLADTAPPQKTTSEKTEDRDEKNMENENSNDVRISFPASLIETNGNISININNRGFAAQPAVSGGLKAIDETTEDFLEIKKVELENTYDYSKCKGYNEKFLGIKIPMPRPKGDWLKYVAKLKNVDESILKYHYFSVIQHAVRKMPIISAINIDGNPDLRLDRTEREDVWLRDRRMDYDMQLNDAFYKSSGFDRGHLSRREDANYGATAEIAKEYADLTCVYTNACPQVPRLNRSTNSGLWGKLEKVILEKGVEKETGKYSKITVLNGPIFSKNDRYYKGIQIPMEFWKIILWFGEGGKLRATAFKLSQETLVESIDFEKLGFDTNTEFKEYRVSIKSLEDKTGLDFSRLLKYDTFKFDDGEESLMMDSENEFAEFVEENFSLQTETTDESYSAEDE